MILNNYKKYIIIINILISISFSTEYTDYEFDIFSVIVDPNSHSLGGAPSTECMSLNNIYTLNEFHSKGKTLFSYSDSYSGIINYFQIIHNNNLHQLTLYKTNNISKPKLNLIIFK